MFEKTERPNETTEAGTGTVEAQQRRALMLKLAAGAFGAPTILAGLTRKAAAASLPG